MIQSISHPRPSLLRYRASYSPRSLGCRQTARLPPQDPQCEMLLDALLQINTEWSSTEQSACWKKEFAGTLCRFGHRSEGRHLGMLKGVDRFRRILVRLGSICLQTLSLSGQRHLLELVIICRSILHALRNFELRVCDVQPKSISAAKLPMCSAASQSTYSCPKLSPHSTLESSLSFDTMPSR